MRVTEPLPTTLTVSVYWSWVKVAVTSLLSSMVKVCGLVHAAEVAAPAGEGQPAAGVAVRVDDRRHCHRWPGRDSLATEPLPTRLTVSEY